MAVTAACSRSEAWLKCGSAVSRPQTQRTATRAVAARLALPPPPELAAQDLLHVSLRANQLRLAMGQ